MKKKLQQRPTKTLAYLHLTKTCQVLNQQTKAGLNILHHFSCHGKNLTR
jgi:hypothetical protein